ncbi:MAG: hypothetical protein ACI87E_003573 [Mariniblastus sp.]|jgi:hypothetical protein
MSDNQRRALCRFVFMLTCMLPTGIVGYRLFHPQTAAGWELAIQAELGLETKIDFVSTPAPYVTFLNNVTVFNADSKKLFHTLEVKIEFGNDFNQLTFIEKANGLTNEGLAELVKTIRQNVIRKHGTTKYWRVQFKEDTTIQEALVLGKSVSPVLPLDSIRPWAANRSYLESSLTLAELQIDISPAAPLGNGTFAFASFKVIDPNATAEQRAAANLVSCEMSKTDEHGSLVELHTRETPLPCWLVASLVPTVSSLGPQATFEGELLISGAWPQSNFEMAGLFKNVKPRVADPLGVGSQAAEIHIHDCKFEHGDFVDWRATLRRHNQTIGQILEDELFNVSKRLDIANAINNSLAPNRTAELPRERY